MNDFGSENRAPTSQNKASGTGAVSRFIKGACPPALKQPYWWARERLAKARLKSLSITRNEFIRDIRLAVEGKKGYAAAKIGASQKSWMYYEIFLSKHHRPEDIKRYESELRFHCLKQEGVFPDSLDFYLEYSRFYIQHIRNLDCLGICYLPAVGELELINYYQLRTKLIFYPLQEPDRSVPSNESMCYLPAFKDKKLLIICPFADFLRERATKEIYENVWSKIGKRWFYPKSVEAIEFPYGFERDTQKRYSTVLKLLEEIQGQIAKKDFDVALIGAGGLSVPIASFVKNRGKVGIDLGGALQFAFGVSGKRWQDWGEYQKNFFNEWWTHLPSRYRPKETDVCDNGAYW